MADFAALAKKYSDDTATAKDGGSVGQLVQGSGTAPEIEKVAFGLAKGQISDLIPTSYGFEIIRVDDKIAAHARSLEEVRSEIEPIVAAQKDQKLAEQLAHTVESQAKSERPGQGRREQRSAGAGERFLHAQRSAARHRLLAAVRRRGLRHEGQRSSSAIPLARGFAVAQVTEVKPPATPSFEQVKDRIASELKQQKAQALLAQKTQELSDKATPRITWAKPPRPWARR